MAAELSPPVTRMDCSDEGAYDSHVVSGKGPKKAQSRNTTSPTTTAINTLLERLAEKELRAVRTPLEGMVKGR